MRCWVRGDRPQGRKVGIFERECPPRATKSGTGISRVIAHREDTDQGNPAHSSPSVRLARCFPSRNASVPDGGPLNSGGVVGLSYQLSGTGIRLQLVGHLNASGTETREDNVPKEGVAMLCDLQHMQPVGVCDMESCWVTSSHHVDVSELIDGRKVIDIA